MIAVDIDGDGVNRTVSELSKTGPIEARVADLSGEDRVQELVTGVESTYGRIDVLFNNASIDGAVAKLVDYPIEVFDRVMAVNVRSIFLTMKYVLPGMMTPGTGAVINMGSTASF